MPFGMREAAGSLGVGLLVSVVTTGVNGYSAFPQDFREGNQDLQLAFDTVEKYGDSFEPDVQEDFQNRYKELMSQKETLQPIRSSLKRFLPSNRQFCADFRRDSEILKEDIISRSQEARCRRTILNTPFSGHTQDRIDESRREASIPEHRDAEEADEPQEADCTTMMSSDLSYGNQREGGGRTWGTPTPLPLLPLWTT